MASTNGVEGHKLTSLGGGRYAVDGRELPFGSYLSESRKRLACDGGCGFTFPDNRERFINFRNRRYCLACAAAGRVE